MRPLKEKVSITLDGDLVEQVKELAEETDRSFSQYINRVLRGHVKRVEERKLKEKQKKEQESEGG